MGPYLVSREDYDEIFSILCCWVRGHKNHKLNPTNSSFNRDEAQHSTLGDDSDLHVYKRLIENIYLGWFGV